VKTSCCQHLTWRASERTESGRLFREYGRALDDLSEVEPVAQERDPAVGSCPQLVRNRRQHFPPEIQTRDAGHDFVDLVTLCLIRVRARRKGDGHKRLAVRNGAAASSGDFPH